MSKLGIFVFIIWAYSIDSNKPQQGSSQIQPDIQQDVGSSGQLGLHNNRAKAVMTSTPKVRALLASRFNALEEFKSVVEIKYFNKSTSSDGTIGRNAKVRLIYRVNGYEVISVLESGITQDDFVKVRDGNIWDRLNLIFKSPYSVINRLDLNKIYKLARRRPAYFGEGDVAFFDLAEATVSNINSPDLAYRNAADSSEKGYLNTFNHITAQALITTFFSRQTADFVADVHERQNMPELTTGQFTDAQLSDPDNYPVDNYVDLINDELGQEIGHELKMKYGITRSTFWSPKLLSDYLNDIQKYYCWSFQIGMKPFRPDDEVIIRFSDKINIVAKGVPYEELY